MGASTSDTDPRAAALPAEMLQALLEQSLELIAITDLEGRLDWVNTRFAAATGMAGDGRTLLLDGCATGVAGDSTRERLASGLAAGALETAGLRLRAADGTPLWVDVRASRLGDRILWTFTDVSSTRFLAAQARHQGELLDTAQEFGRLGIWERRLPGGEGRWDRHVFGFWGLDPANGTPSHDEASQHVHPDDRALIFRDSTRIPGRYSQRYRVIDPAGKLRWIHSQWEVKNGPLGTPDRAVGVMMDDTAAYEAARQADELARRLEAASQAAGIGLWSTADHPREADWNAQTFALFDRFTPPRVPDFGEWLRECVHPDDRERVARDAHLYLATDHPGPFDLEFRIVRRDDSVRWVVMRADLDPLARQRRRVLGIVMDVTDHHMALAALRDASERASIIARHAGIGMWESRLDGSPERWDEQMYRLRDMEPGETVPDRDLRTSMVHPDDRHHLIDSMTQEELSGATSYEFRLRLPDGRWRWLASRSALVYDDHGRAVRRVGVNWDVTEAKETELMRQQAVLAEQEIRAKSEFLSRMSHELRTPLNAVLGFTQLLQIEARHAADSVQLAKLGHIRAAGDHLLSLINDVLDLSSLESGAMKLAAGAVDLGSLVRESVLLVESLAAQHGVTVEIEQAQGAALGDPTRLRQVLINLLSNAIKYNRRGGRVEVAATAAGEVVRLRVRDTGRGLTPMQQAGLFEPFNRFGAESDGIEGTGIGLTIVKALVEGMAGSVAVSSTPGQGTVFEVTLPSAGPEHAAESPADAVDSAQAPWTEPRRERAGQILYIEDNQVNVLLVEELVKTVSGLAIASELTGQAGVARARTMRPDLVLIDLQLPDFDGFEVLRRLRADPETRAIPCIALSANAMPEDIERGLAAGFADYWTKPIDFAAFLTALKKRFPEEPASASGRLVP